MATGLGVLALVAGGVAAALRVAGPGAGTTSPLADQTFPIVVPPSYGPLPPATTAGLPDSAGPASPSAAVAGSLPGPGPGVAPDRSPGVDLDVGLGRPVAPAPASRSAGTGPAATAGATLKGRPISAYAACSTGKEVVLTATFAAGLPHRRVLIDTDADTGSGYQVPDLSLGADFMIENDVLYRSTGPDWSWRQVKGVSPLAARKGGTYRWLLRSPRTATTVVFNGANDTTDVSSPPVPVRPC